MKRLICLVLVLCVFPCVSFASDFWSCYTTFGEADGLSFFDHNDFSISLFMMTDLRAYIVVTTFDDAQISTTTYYAKTKTKTNDPNTLYFVFADDTYFTGRYGGEYQQYFWLDIDPSHSIRLDYVDEYVPLFALKEQ